MPSQPTSMLPVIPVRLNRALVLRQQSRAKRGDSSQAFNPVKSEVGPYVQGQNKAVKQGFKKQIHAWFREQTFMLEKLNRYQTQTYEKLARLEVEKRHLVSYVDVPEEGPDEAEGKKPKPPSPPEREPPLSTQKAVGFTETVEVKSDNQVHQVALPALSSIPEGDNEPDDHLEVKHSGSGRLVGASSLPELDKAGSISTHNVDIKKQSRQSGIATNSVEHLPDLVAKEPLQPEAGDALFHLTESPLPGARRADVPVPSSAGSSIDPRALYRKLRTQPSTDTPKSSLAHMKIGRSKTTLQEKRSKQLDRSPWTLYNKDNTSGEISASQFPYKRREFEKPKEKDWAMFRTLIRAEDKHRRKTHQKFERLSADLDTLEQWNPLDQIRDRYHLKAVSPSAEPMAQLQRVTGSLGAMIAAFGGQEECLLSQLDPESPEALRLCRYLRRNENREAEDNDMAGDSLQRRQSWTASGAASGAGDRTASGAVEGTASGAASGAGDKTASGAVGGTASGAASGAASGEVDRTASEAVERTAGGAASGPGDRTASGAASAEEEGTASGAVEGTASAAVEGTASGAVEETGLKARAIEEADGK